MKPFAAVLMASGVAIAIYLVIVVTGNRGPDLSRQLANMAEAGNAYLPMMIDTETRLDSMFASSDDAFEYSYTLVNRSADQINRGAFEELVRPHLKSALCTGADNELFRANRVKMVYTYYASDGVEVASVAIPASSCEVAA